MSIRASDVYLKNNVKPLTEKQRLEEEEKRRYAEMLQITEKLTKEAQANSYRTQGNNTKEPIYYILVTAGVLVLGYFAYKKFKK
jgi:hypothetical protein